MLCEGNCYWLIDAGPRRSVETRAPYTSLWVRFVKHLVKNSLFGPSQFVWASSVGKINVKVTAEFGKPPQKGARKKVRTN